MNIASILCGAVLAISSSVNASVGRVDQSNYPELLEGSAVVQYLWSDEWSEPENVEEAPLDEAQLMDLPSHNETKMVAGYLWNIALPEEQEVATWMWDIDRATPAEETDGAALFAQYLWSDEWSESENSEEAPLDEAHLMDLPSHNETEMVAGYLWNIALPEEQEVATWIWDIDNAIPAEEALGAALLAQYLWSDEWSDSENSEESPLDEAQLMDLPSHSETEMVAGYLWNIALPEEQEVATWIWDIDNAIPAEEAHGAALLAQYLWSDEWSDSENSEESPVDEAQLMDLPSHSVSEMVAGYLWNIVLPQEQEVATWMWDIDNNTPAENEDAVVLLV